MTITTEEYKSLMTDLSNVEASFDAYTQAVSYNLKGQSLNCVVVYRHLGKLRNTIMKLEPKEEPETEVP